MVKIESEMEEVVAKLNSGENCGFCGTNKKDPKYEFIDPMLGKRLMCSQVCVDKANAFWMKALSSEYKPVIPYRHPNIQKIYDIWEEKGCAQLASEQRREKIKELLSAEVITELQISMLKTWATHYNNLGLKEELKRRGW